MESLHDAARDCLLEPDVDTKLAATRRTATSWRCGELSLGDGVAPSRVEDPGRPERPRLVPPRELPRRGPQSLQGRAALLHAVCHIEFNAINLAWDAVYRFRDLPGEYYTDWVRIAAEETRHFVLVRRHLATLGYAYGDFDAHNGLWELAVRTDHDPLVRMALVPRVMEARGLDVTPGMRDRLAAVGDTAAAAILETILTDEVGHVEAGSRWFRYLCRQRGEEPEATYHRLVAAYLRGPVKPPLNRPARLAGGFTEAELDYLEAQT
ncbi:ferritin-like domain-containing protein [Thiohalospira sp.]|uniref:ferritin-like domain-containing protein n=1 Tax=Thiohalospira sp. TaxID=3080549 RepID=UPI00397FD420